jgi:hypothetical protein
MLRRIAIVAGLILLGAVYLAGYWPEHQQNRALEARVAALQEQLSRTRADLHVARLLGEALNLGQLVSRQDYGEAQAASTRFFDGVRNEAAASPDVRVKDALNATLELRDSVTASLTKADPAVAATLGQIQDRLRTALGYPVPAAGPKATAGRS